MAADVALIHKCTCRSGNGVKSLEEKRRGEGKEDSVGKRGGKRVEEREKRRVEVRGEGRGKGKEDSVGKRERKKKKVERRGKKGEWSEE